MPHRECQRTSDTGHPFLPHVTRPARSPPRRRLTRPFYERDTLVVARDLLGRVLCRRTAHGILRGRIVEVDRNNDRIQRFETDGTFVDTVGMSGSGSTPASRPALPKRKNCP